MENEKTIMNEADNSSNEKATIPNRLENSHGFENVHLEKDPGGFSIPDPDAHLSPEEKAAVVSKSHSQQIEISGPS